MQHQQVLQAASYMPTQATIQELQAQPNTPEFASQINPYHQQNQVAAQ
jgi:hypothetical protein